MPCTYIHVQCIFLLRLNHLHIILKIKQIKKKQDCPRTVCHNLLKVHIRRQIHLCASNLYWLFYYFFKVLWRFEDWSGGLDILVNNLQKNMIHFQCGLKKMHIVSVCDLRISKPVATRATKFLELTEICQFFINQK